MLSPIPRIILLLMALMGVLRGDVLELDFALNPPDMADEWEGNSRGAHHAEGSAALFIANLLVSKAPKKSALEVKADEAAYGGVGKGQAT